MAGLVRRHMLDTGGDAPYRLEDWLRGRPAPRRSPFALPLPPCPLLPCPSPGAYFGLPLLAPGAPSGPYTLVWAHSLPLALCSVSRVPTSVTCAPACSADARVPPLSLVLSPPLPAPWPAPCALLLLALAPCLCPCVRPRALLIAPPSFPCPCPCLVLCPVSLHPLPALPAPFPCPCPLSLPCAPWPVPCICPWALSLSPSAPRPALLWPAPCPAPAPSRPSWTTRPASRCRCSCSSVMPGGVRWGTGGRTGRSLPLGKAAFGGYSLAGLVWLWLGLVWARYLALSLPSASAVAAHGEALGARVGLDPRASSVLGAVARLAGDAVSAPCASRGLLRGRGGRAAD